MTATQASKGTPVEIRDVEKVFATEAGPVLALDRITLTLDPGKVTCVLGPSGCGKSTLMLLVAGLDKPTAGSIEIDGVPVTKPYVDLGVVFQSDLLLEWHTALQNVLMQFVLRGLSPAPHEERARELLELVGVGEFADRYPAQLSGGMRQRVAICRALAHDPPLLLMDEPFGALDALTRERITTDLAAIAETTQKTILFITHSIEEAVLLGDRVVVLSPRPGRVVDEFVSEVGHPRRPSVMEEPVFLEHVRRVRRVLEEEGIL